MKRDKQIVARTHTNCPICGKETNEAILISQRLQDISELDNVSTGFSNPCDECQAGIDMGAIMIIVIDESKSSGHRLDEIWRTGIIHGLKQEAVERMLNDNEILQRVLKTRVMMLDYKVAREFGLPVDSYTP